MSDGTSERKGCWGCLGGLFTVLAVGFAIIKWGILPIQLINFWNDVEKENRSREDTAAEAKIIHEHFLEKEENDGERVKLFDNKLVPLYYPTIVTIKEGEAADRAGMKEGDRLLRIDGNSVLWEFRETDYVEKTLDACRSKTVPILVMREGKRVPLTVTVSAQGTIGIRFNMQKKQ